MSKKTSRRLAGRIPIARDMVRKYIDHAYYSRKLLRNVLPPYPGADVKWRGYAFIESYPEIYRIAMAIRISYLLQHLFPMGRIREIESRVRLIKEKMDSVAEELNIPKYCVSTPDKILLYAMRYVSARRLPQDERIHVEIGTAQGGSLIATLMALADAGSRQKVVCIDPLERYYGRDDVPQSREIVEQSINFFGFDCSMVEFVQHLSQERAAIDTVKGRGVVSLLIDGDHSYNGVKADWENYASFVVPGGYVLFDNYNDYNWPDVTEFAHRELSSHSEGWHVRGSFDISLLLRRRQ